MVQGKINRLKQSTTNALRLYYDTQSKNNWDVGVIIGQFW